MLEDAGMAMRADAMVIGTMEIQATMAISTRRGKTHILIIFQAINLTANGSPFSHLFPSIVLINFT